MTRTIASPIGLFATALLCFFSCARPTTAPRGPVRDNVLLISIDTLRADHLGSYDYERVTSPELDRLAAESVRFDSAYAPAPWTLPSHATMLTGIHAWDLGITSQWKKLPAETRLLSETLAAAGYRTAAIVDSPPAGFVGAERGFDRGFDSYQHLPRRPGQFFKFDAAATVDAALDWLEQRDRGRPFFLFLHSKAVHAEANSDPCFDERCFPYDTEEQDRLYFLSAEDAAIRWTDPELGSGQEYLWEVNRRIHVGAMDPRSFPDERLRALVALYDAGIRTVDRHLGRLFATLREDGVLDETIVIVTSDHGEAFLDHALLMHQEVHEETVRVPLLIRLPGAGSRIEERVVTEPASLEDIVPTVLELLGLDPPSETTGRSLPLNGQTAAAADREFFHYYTFRERFVYQAFALRRGDLKLIIHNLGDPDHPRAELFNLADDPGESEPLGEAAAGFEALRQQIRQRIARPPLADGGEIAHPQQPLANDLTALGYID